MTIEIEIIFKDASAPKKIDADNCYTKGEFYCIRVGDMLIKYPLQNIFSVCHEHGYHCGSAAHLEDIRSELK
jgi:hypothetical protein